MDKEEKLNDGPQIDSELTREGIEKRHREIMHKLNEAKDLMYTPEDRILFMKFAASMFKENEIILIAEEIKFEALSRLYHTRR